MLPVNMEMALVNLINQELRVFKELEKLTYDMERRPDYSVFGVYRCIDRNNEGRLDRVNLDHFFKLQNLFLTDRELYAIIRRVDTTADQTISLEEL